MSFPNLQQVLALTGVGALAFATWEATSGNPETAILWLVIVIVTFWSYITEK